MVALKRFLLLSGYFCYVSFTCTYNWSCFCHLVEFMYGLFQLIFFFVSRLFCVYHVQLVPFILINIILCYILPCISLLL